MVVFIRDYAMEDDGRRKRGGFFRRLFAGGSWSLTAESRQPSNLSIAVNTPPSERRPLRTVPTVGDQHKVNPETLVKSYVEKEIKYLGTINDITPDFVASDRTVLLSLLDEKQRIGQLPSQLGFKNDVICSFSIHNVKVLRRDGERLVHRIPTHKIASTGFTQDDAKFFFFIKFASELSESINNLAIFQSESKVLVEELCSLTQQLFDLAYTESTMDFFDKSIQDGADTPKNNSCSTDDSGERKTETVKLSAKLQQTIQRLIPDLKRQKSSESNSISNLASRESTAVNTSSPDSTVNPLDSNHLHRSGNVKERTTVVSVSAPSSIRSRRDLLVLDTGRATVTSSPNTSSSTPSTPTRAVPLATVRVARSDSSITSSSSHAVRPSSHQMQDVELQEYIAVLKECLSEAELTMFALHLHKFRHGGLTIHCFLDQLMSIYTDKRKSLLLGMRNFIPARDDRQYFDHFLKRHQIDTASFRSGDCWEELRTSSDDVIDSCTTSLTTDEFPDISSNNSVNDESGVWTSSVTGGGGGQHDVIVDERDDVTSMGSTLKRCGKEEDREDRLSRKTSSRDLVLHVEASHLLRSVDDTTVPASSPPAHDDSSNGDGVYVRRNAGKTAAGYKSPSAVELGAPFASFAACGTDDDMVMSSENMTSSQSNDDLDDEMVTHAAAAMTSTTSSPSRDHRKKKRHKSRQRIVTTGCITEL